MAPYIGVELTDGLLGYEMQAHVWNQPGAFSGSGLQSYTQRPRLTAVVTVAAEATATVNLVFTRVDAGSSAVGITGNSNCIVTKV